MLGTEDTEVETAPWWGTQQPQDPSKQECATGTIFIVKLLPVYLEHWVASLPSVHTSQPEEVFAGQLHSAL